MPESAASPTYGNGESRSGYVSDGPSRQPLETLHEYLEADNVADLLNTEKLAQLGEKVRREYDIDKSSRAEWEENSAEGMKLALQVAEKKNYPWPGAANIKYPLLTSAAIQFAARAYPAIVPGKDVVKAKVTGKDEDGSKRKRGDRVARFMSWQLTEEMVEWDEDTDRLLHILPIVGLCYRKTNYDPLLGRNKSELVTAEHLVINDSAKSIDTVPRITHTLEFYPYQIEERMRSGIWKRVELGMPEDARDDADAPHWFLEQYRTADLDGDGYAEPYIVTIHRDTSLVVRIIPNFKLTDVAFNEAGQIARIERNQCFTKYGLFPNPSGGFHDIGFGILLRPIGEAVNSTLNQLLDAGHLANLGGGFIGSGARLRGGQQKVKPGQWLPVNVGGQKLRDNLVPFPFKEPSSTLFQLLGLLIDAGKDISSVKDVMTGGESQGKNASPTTVLALIEQGMQVFSAIYKRVFRSLKSEYGKLYRLNGIYLDGEQYFTVLDEQEAVKKEDFAEGDYDVAPAADPKMVTSLQRLARAEFLMQFANDPHFDPKKIRERMLDAASIEDMDELLLEESPQDPGLAKEADEIDIKKQELRLKGIKTEAEIGKISAEIVKLLADAEAVEPGQQMQAYLGLMDALTKRAQLAAAQAKNGDKDVGQGGVRSVEGQPADQGVPSVPSGAA